MTESDVAGWGLTELLSALVVCLRVIFGVAWLVVPFETGVYHVLST